MGKVGDDFFFLSFFSDLVKHLQCADNDMFINLGIANYQVHRIYLGIAKLPGAPVIIYFSAAQVRF